MSIDNFLALFNGIFCDYDGAFADQCVDLANYYARFVVRTTPFIGQWAYMIFDEVGDLYEQIVNLPDNMPKKGDIVVWANEFNNAGGHVGIATGASTDVNQFEVLEQNDPTGSPCHTKIYSYEHVRGWLHPKNIIDPLAECLSMHTTLVDEANQKDHTITDLTEQVNSLKTQLIASDHHITELEARLTPTPPVNTPASPATHDAGVPPEDTTPQLPITPQEATKRWPHLTQVISEIWDLLNTKI